MAFVTPGGGTYYGGGNASWYNVEGLGKFSPMTGNQLGGPI